MRKTPPPRISKKKLETLNGRVPFSSIDGPRSEIARSGKPKANAKRKRKTSERANGPKARRLWTKQQPCCVPSCGIVGYSDGAHIESAGMGLKAHYTKTIPLCGRALEFALVGVVSHHTELDAGNGREAFEVKYGISLADEAAKHEARWQEFSNGSAG